VSSIKFEAAEAGVDPHNLRLQTSNFKLPTSNFQRATGGAVCTNKPNLGSSGSSVLGPQQQHDKTGKKKREEAVQGAGMVGPFLVP